MKRIKTNKTKKRPANRASVHEVVMPQILLSKCCNVKLQINANKTHTWTVCSLCGGIGKQITNHEMIGRIEAFINEPDESDSVPYHGIPGGA